MESVHPLVVHFPVALLIAAFVLDGAALIIRKPAWHRVALWNLALGVLGAATAVLTGYQAAEIAKHTFEIHQVMGRHRQFAVATLIVGSLVTAWRLWMRDRMRGPVRALVIVVMLVMVGALGYTAHLGGRLVYEFGVGGVFGRPTQPAALQGP